MSARVARRVVVHGWVQGVFFRASVRDVARSRGVAGWAANRPDGTVGLVLEGDPEAVEAVIDYCRCGPRGAAVERVEVSEEAVTGLDHFETR